jgi:hypothetical protein
MEDVGTFYCHLVYFAAFGTFCVHLVHIGMSWLFGIFFPFWYVVPRKIWQPCLKLNVIGCPDGAMVTATASGTEDRGLRAPPV